MESKYEPKIYVEPAGYFRKSTRKKFGLGEYADSNPKKKAVKRTKKSSK